MKYYIATRLERHADHNAVRDRLNEAGWTCTFDWTIKGSVKNVGQEPLQQAALDETQGVLDADVVIVLLPGGRGTHVELGIAIAAGKPIVLQSETGSEFTLGEETSAFYHHPQVRRVVSAVRRLAEDLLGSVDSNNS